MRARRLCTALVAAIFVGGCGAEATSSSATPTASATASATSIPTPTSVPDPLAGWISYHSAANHLTFMHPPQWTPVECGWVYFDTVGTTTCPTDGAGGILLSASDNHAQGTFSTISGNPSLYSNIKRAPATVAGVSGTRISADQTMGMGGGSSQVEYDFKVGTRSYILLAYVKYADSPASGDITEQFDHLVQTVTFA